MPQVSIRSGQGQGVDKRIPIGGQRTTIGRSADNDIALADRLLSRRHAEILRRADGCYLIDRGSTNGTYLNGARVREQPLHDGDVITLGEHTIVFCGDDRLLGHVPAAATPVRSYPVLDLVGRSTRNTTDVAELLQQKRVLSVLTRATASLLVHYPLPQLFDKILELMLEATPAERGAIMLLEGEPPNAVVAASRSRDGRPPVAQVSRSIVERVIAWREALLLPDVLEDVVLRGRQSIRTTDIRSAMCAPLWVATPSREPDRVLGLVYLDTRASRAPFSERDLEVLVALANVAAAKIENAHLIEENLLKHRLEEDLRLAAEIQAGLLPSNAPVITGYDIAATTRPCRVGSPGTELEFAL